VKRKNLVTMLTLFMLFLSCTSWGQVAQCGAPPSRVLGLDLQSIAPLSAQPAENFGGGKDIKSGCTASCGIAPSVSCSGSGSCSAIDQNCSLGQQGYVVCGSTWNFCPPCSPDPGCSQYNSKNCVYSWDASTLCCIAQSGCLVWCY
jgi:hypothetical protein